MMAYWVEYGPAQLIPHEVKNESEVIELMNGSNEIRSSNKHFGDVTSLCGNFPLFLSAEQALTHWMQNLTKSGNLTQLQKLKAHIGDNTFGKMINDAQLLADAIIYGEIEIANWLVDCGADKSQVDVYNLMLSFNFLDRCDELVSNKGYKEIFQIIDFCCGLGFSLETGIGRTLQKNRLISSLSCCLEQCIQSKDYEYLQKFKAALPSVFEKIVKKLDIDQLKTDGHLTAKVVNLLGINDEVSISQLTSATTINLFPSVKVEEDKETQQKKRSRIGYNNN